MSAAVIDATYPRPILIVTGENTFEAARQAQIAEGWADAAANSAGAAEAFVGPTYTSQAAGEAATTAGQFFAVIVSGIVTIFARTSGGSTAVRNMATTDALFASGGSALIRWIASGSGAVARTIESVLREFPVSIKSFGAVCDSGTTPDNAAIQAAVASGAKRIYIPNGTTVSPGTLTFDNINGVHFFGDGLEASYIYVTGTTGPYAFQFTNSQDVGLNDLGIIYTQEQTAGWAVIYQNCYTPTINIFIQYHYNGVWMQSGSELTGYVRARYAFGFYGVLFGDSALGVYGSTLRYHGDNPPPVGITGYKAYAASTAYTLGQVTSSNSRVYVCTQAGTTGAGSAPTGTSGGTFSTDIADGTARWRFIYSISFAHITMDSNANSIRIEKSFGLNGAYAFRMIDSLNTGSSSPNWVYLGLEADHNFAAGVSLEAGSGVYLNDNAWVGSCLSGNGIQTVGAFKGEMSISPSVRVLGNAQHGLLINAGHVFDIQGMYSGNSIANYGSYHGIVIANGITGLNISATCGLNDLLGATQGFGVYLLGGNDYYRIGGVLIGNISGAISGHVETVTKVYSGVPSLSPVVSAANQQLVEILAGQTSVTFNHTLGGVPTSILYSSRTNLAGDSPYIAAITTTTVTLSINAALAYNAFFDVRTSL